LERQAAYLKEHRIEFPSYISPEQRIRHDHPLRKLRVMADEALRELKPRFNRLYAKTGRPSIGPEMCSHSIRDAAASIELSYRLPSHQGGQKCTAHRQYGCFLTSIRL
jgi:hypothetical protein